MAEVTNFIPNLFATDIVGIYDANFNQAFKNARPMKARVKTSAKVMQHPLETGAVITDHIVYEPIEVELPVSIQANDYSNTYQLIRSAYIAGQIFSVQTRTQSYLNMILSALPHEEDPAHFDLIAVSLKFTEAKFVSAQYSKLPPSKVKKKAQASTAKKGEVKAEEPKISNPSRAAVLFGLGG